jgi:hypothetical protein
MGVNHGHRGPALGMAVGPGEIGLHDQPAPVLHQGVADEAEHGAGAGRLLVEPRVGIGGRGMGRIRPLLAPEVDLGIPARGFWKRRTSRPERRPHSITRQLGQKPLASRAATKEAAC